MYAGVQETSNILRGKHDTLLADRDAQQLCASELRARVSFMETEVNEVFREMDPNDMLLRVNDERNMLISERDDATDRVSALQRTTLELHARVIEATAETAKCRSLLEQLETEHHAVAADRDNCSRQHDDLVLRVAAVDDTRAAAAMARVMPVPDSASASAAAAERVEEQLREHQERAAAAEAALQTQVRELEDELRAAQGEVAVCVAERAASASRCEDAQVRVSQLEDDVMMLSTKVRVLESDLWAVQDEEDEDDEDDEDASGAQRAMKLLTVLRGQYDTCKTERDAAQTQVEELRRAVCKADAAVSDAAGVASTRAIEWGVERDSLLAHVRRLEDEVLSLKTQLGKVREQLASTKTDKDRLRREKMVLEGSVNQLHMKLSKELKKAGKAAAASSAATTSALAALEAEADIETLRIQLREATLALAAMQQQQQQQQQSAASPSVSVSLDDDSNAMPPPLLPQTSVLGAVPAHLADAHQQRYLESERKRLRAAAARKKHPMSPALGRTGSASPLPSARGVPNSPGFRAAATDSAASSMDGSCSPLLRARIPVPLLIKSGSQAGTPRVGAASPRVTPASGRIRQNTVLGGVGASAVVKSAADTPVMGPMSTHPEFEEMDDEE